MGYYEHLPVNYADDLKQKFPLLVFIHGWENARFLDPQTVQAPLSILENSNLVKLINDGAWDDSLPFIVLSPQKCYDGLTFGVTAARMKRFIDYAINTYKVDVSRLYMSGHSQGSGDTWDYVSNYPQQLAAVVPISGGYGTVSGCALKDTPAWAFNGEADKTVPYHNQVNTVASINACNPAEPAKVTVFPGISHNDIQAQVLNLAGLGSGLPQYSPYDQNIYDWLLQHRRP
jgi:predicted peptidase